MPTNDTELELRELEKREIALYTIRRKFEDPNKQLLEAVKYYRKIIEDMSAALLEANRRAKLKTPIVINPENFKEEKANG